MDLENSETNLDPDDSFSAQEEQREGSDEEQQDYLHIEWAGYI